MLTARNSSTRAVIATNQTGSARRIPVCFLSTASVTRTSPWQPFERLARRAEPRTDRQRTPERFPGPRQIIAPGLCKPEQVPHLVLPIILCQRLLVRLLRTTQFTR